jgi:alanine dehydrogenase
MNGALPRTSAFALNNVTLPFDKAMADKGWGKACADDPHLARGLNVRAGKVTHPAVAKALHVELAA